jgi:translocation and assembly module TamB
MARRRRVLFIGLATVVCLLLATGIGGLIIVRSDWFFEQVRQKLVSTVETATGGRVEAASFHFDWSHLRAEVRGFALHGTEPAGKPALVRANRVTVGLKIISVWKRDLDIESLDVDSPHVFLKVFPDGQTNIPEPKIKKKKSERNTLETILDLKIRRVHIDRGIYEMDTRGTTPFQAHGENLRVALAYDGTGPRYSGDLSMQPLVVTFPDIGAGKPVPFGVQMKVALEGNRIAINSGRLTTGGTQVDLTGELVDIRTPRLSFEYQAKVAISDVARIFRVPELRQGGADLKGRAAWSDAAGFTASGDVHGYRVEYRDATLTLRDGRAEGTYAVGEPGVEVNQLRLAANYVYGTSRVPVEGNIRQVTIRHKDVDIRSAGLTLLGGSFRGEAHVRNLDRFGVDGEISGIEIKRTVAIYSPQQLPWDGRAFGPVHLESSLRRKSELSASAKITVAPAVQGAPVHGLINAGYTARTGVLDLGSSTLSLPSSQVDFSGTLPPGPGREMRVHLETRNLDDFLPALGQSASSLPVKLAGGSVVFDGTVTGDLDQPQINGKLNATRFAYTDQAFDSLQGSVRVSPVRVELHDGTVARGDLRAQVEAVVGMREWKTDDASPIAASARVRNVDMKELLAAAKAGDVPVTGVLTGSAQVAGSIGRPIATGDVELVKGSLYEEPFDAFRVHATYSDRKLDLQGGEILAGPSRVQLAATYEHTAAGIDSGRLKFNISSNEMPVERFETLRKARPGARGTVQATARGDLEFQPPSNGRINLRIADMHADINARGLQVTGQALGDAHLTADSQGQVLRTRLESDFANSTIRGDGSWRLEGDYPGSATITFARLDFEQLRQWVAPTQPGAVARLTGSAEGELKIEGPALKPDAMKAELRLPKFQLGAKPDPGTPAAAALAIQNDGDLVATLAGSVITIERAHLKGRSTDLNVGGKVSFQQKSPLDVHIEGSVNLDLAHDFLPDLTARGTLTTDASIRGAFDNPQIVGRVQFKDAAFNVGDLPNGISEANAVIQFTGDRATIQSFTGSTGGGKVDLAGFVGYGAGDLVFRLHAEARSVRVRIPEGVSIVADSSLDFTGTTERSMLAGNISILRTGFNLQSDFSSVIAKSAEPVQTPSARTGLLGGLNFDIQVSTAPDVQLQSALTQDLQAEANLQLRGTVSNPALVGRITVTQGQLIFYGTKYTINQGTISFYNPLKIEPLLDIDLETKARGIDITLSVQGPLNKPTLTPRSDPPLQFSEIVALLATGSTPTSDPTLLARQSTSPQSFQQTGASALLGQAIASPVAGRLQRFFGVSKLRIDPTLPGVENNPQARLTIEQQVTPDITFTYITNVTNSNPQVVRIEWSWSKQWSVVALRDENGTFGLDFFFKKQF